MATLSQIAYAVRHLAITQGYPRGTTAHADRDPGASGYVVILAPWSGARIEVQCPEVRGQTAREWIGAIAIPPLPPSGLGPEPPAHRYKSRLHRLLDIPRRVA